MQELEIISSGLLELYATGLTSKEEALQVEQWIKEYPGVAAELTAIQSGLEGYAQVHAIPPGSAVKEKLFKQINAKEQVKVVALPSAKNKNEEAKVFNLAAYWKRVAAVAVVFLFGSIVLNLLYYNKFDEASKTLASTQKKLNDISESNKEMKDDMLVVQSKYSKPVMLDGQAASPDAAAKVFWMKNTGEVYIDPSNLPDVPEGKQFQLWAIVDGQPVDAGMILTSKKGEKFRIQKMKSFGKADAFAITIEKEGGSPTPTMDQMVVMGKM